MWNKKKYVEYIWNGIVHRNKENEILTFVTWMYLDGIVLSEITQAEKDKCPVILQNKNRLIGTENKRGWLPEGRGCLDVGKDKESIVNILIFMHNDRWLLELGRLSQCKV